MASYIRKRGIGGFDGRQLNINIESIQRNKGTPPSRIGIPGFSAENQQSIPVLGQQDDINILIRIKTETSNVAFDVSSGGSTIAHSPSITSIKDQYNFLYDEVLTNNVSANYELYIEWLDLTYRGTLLLNDQVITSERFGQEIFITLIVSRGKNFIYDSLT